jgi:DNA-binding response OmpR family regulator
MQSVDVAADGEDGLHLATHEPYDLVILDIMLPVHPGDEILRRMRAAGIATPALFLTARDSLADRVAGLDLGADDYVVKPFEFSELLARIRAVLRRARGAAEPELAVGDLVIDPARHTVTRGGERVDLLPREYALLEYLARHAGEVCSRTKILEHVWSMDFDTLSNVVDVHINHLRRKLDRGGAPPLIHTVRGVGYVLEERP